MNESEAKEKWCPFVRFQDGNYSGNRIGTQIKPEEIPSYCRCIGSGCMAWRWIARETRITTINGQRTVETLEPGVAGYCGLAGRP